MSLFGVAVAQEVEQVIYFVRSVVRSPVHPICGRMSLGKILNTKLVPMAVLLVVECVYEILMVGTVYRSHLLLVCECV